MQPRRIARELALLSMGQLPHQSERLAEQDLQNLILAAIRTLSGEVREALETAATELKRGHERLVESEFRAADLRSARAMVADAMALTQTAVNRLGTAMELPELIQLALRDEVREYAMKILQTLIHRRPDIDKLLEDSLVDWQLGRLAQIDRSILRIATAEMVFLEVPDRVAINEAVELCKRYSAEDSHRFVNGVLRRVTQKLAQSQAGVVDVP